jgi:hypothetical protein
MVGKMNVLNGKKDFPRSTYFKLLSQIKENLILKL